VALPVAAFLEITKSVTMRATTATMIQPAASAQAKFEQKRDSRRPSMFYGQALKSTSMILGHQFS